MRAERRRPGAVARLRFGDEHRGCLVEPEAAQLFRNIDAQEAQFAGLREQLLEKRIVLLLQPSRGREDLLGDELGTRREELPLLVREPLRRHERGGTHGREEEISTARVLRRLGKVLDLLRHVRSSPTRTPNG